MLKALKQWWDDLTPNRVKAERAAKLSEPVTYNGFTIIPDARKEGSHWLAAGVIRKEGPDGVRETPFIRSDSFGARENANEFAVIKARQLIDERGDKLFDVEWP